MKNGVPATAPSIRAACADWVRRSSAILTRGMSGFALTFASAHSREGSARCSAAYNAIRSVTCSGSRYPRRTNWRVPLQARESRLRERSSTRSGVAMAPLAGARRGFEPAALRAFDGRDRDRHHDGGEDCDTDKHDDRRDHAYEIERDGDPVATVSALTTSLPETPGRERNRDYRFIWIRDTTFTLQALHYLDLDWEADEFMQFVADLAPNEDGGLQIKVWKSPDQGIWDARGAPQHYVSSKLMCWVALDRPAMLAGIRGDSEAQAG